MCRAAGQGPASKADKDPDDEEELIPRSQAMIARREAARVFDAGRSHDLLGLVRRELLRRLGLSGLSESRQRRIFPNQFEHLARASGYMAVVATDGHRVGSRSKEWRELKTGDFFQREAHGECFFHAMRGTVRIALIDVLVEIFEQEAKQIGEGNEERLPFRLLSVTPSSSCRW